MITRDIHAKHYPNRPVVRVQSFEALPLWFNIVVGDAHTPATQVAFPKSMIPELIAALEEISDAEVAS